MAGLDADEYALDELTCPITGEIFLDPVLCVGDGHTYERLAAERWLATHATSFNWSASGATGRTDAGGEPLCAETGGGVIQRRPELRPTAPPRRTSGPPPAPLRRPCRTQ